MMIEKSPDTESASIFGEISRAIEMLDRDRSMLLIQKAIGEGFDPLAILQEGIVVGLKEIGRKFHIHEYFLAELILGGQVSKACISFITPYLPKTANAKSGVLVIGAVKGDLHDIGMNLVITHLQIAGFEVHNLGIDVPSLDFIEKAREVNADIIGMSGFMTTTIPYFSEVIDYLRDMGLRKQFKVIIGGGPTSKDYANSIGADGWAANSTEAVNLCQLLMPQ